jgi:hypothetical protein
MIPLSIDNFEKQSMIELVILPHMDYLSFIAEFIDQAKHLIILDTQGYLNLNFGSNKWMEDKETREQMVDYSFIHSFADLFEKLETLRNVKNFVLILDSVTFVGDRAPNSVTNLCKALWAIIYETNSTVITINHFRIGKEKRTYKLVPRMGKAWERTVSYRIRFQYKNGKIVYDKITPSHFNQAMSE